MVGIKPRYLALIGIFLFMFFTESFSQAILQGNVKNIQGQPIAFTNILVLDIADSSLIRGGVCDESGHFYLSNIPKGNYLITAHMLGFRPFYSPPISVEVNNIQPFEIVLTEDEAELSEVLVTAKKPLFEQQMGKLVVNVNSSIISSGSTVLEVLSRTPGVLVNQQNNTITLNGKEGVMVMFNGKLVRLPLEAVIQMLAGMNADQVSTIEIIHSPPARYDAEGNAGLINIVSKEILEMGTNGSFSGNFGTSFDKETLERYGGSVNVNHRGKKFSFYLNASARMDHFLLFVPNFRSIISPVGDLISDSNMERDFYTWTLNGQGGFEFVLNPNTSIGGQVTGISTKQDQDAFGHTDIRESNVLNTRIFVNDLERNHWWGYGSNLYFSHKFKRGSLLTIDADYLYYFHNNPHDYRFRYSNISEQTEEVELLINDKHTPIHIWVGKIDFQKQLNNKITMEMGAKGTFSDIENKILANRSINEIWSKDSVLSQHVLMKENIGAAYISLDTDISIKTKMQAGLRYEYTHTFLHNVSGDPILERNYGNFFPNISISKKFNEDNNMVVSYGRRITRPTYGDLAPFVTFLDPLNLLMGNIELFPSLSNSFKSNYQFKKSYSLALDITQIKNFIGWDIIVIPEQNRQLNQTNNIDNILNISLSLSAPNNFVEWWEGNSSIMGVFQQVNSIWQKIPMERKMQYIHINSTQNFKFGNGYSAEISGFYMSPQLYGLLTIKSFGTLNLGIQKELMKNRGSFKLSGEDIFWTNRFYAVTNNSQMGFESKLGFILTSRLIRLTYTKNFGDTGIKSVKKAAGSEEERNRAQ